MGSIPSRRCEPHRITAGYLHRMNQNENEGSHEVLSPVVNIGDLKVVIINPLS